MSDTSSPIAHSSSEHFVHGRITLNTKMGSYIDTMIAKRVHVVREKGHLGVPLANFNSSTNGTGHFFEESSLYLSLSLSAADFRKIDRNGRLG